MSFERMPFHFLNLWTIKSIPHAEIQLRLAIFVYSWFKCRQFCMNCQNRPSSYYVSKTKSFYHIFLNQNRKLIISIEKRQGCLIREFIKIFGWNVHWKDSLKFESKKINRVLHYINRSLQIKIQRSWQIFTHTHTAYTFTSSSVNILLR